MEDHVTDRKSRQLSQHEVLPQADLHALWQLESGTLRIDSAGPDGSSELTRLALPGDYLGVENLVGMQDSLTVRAITPARLVPVTLMEEGQRMQLLMDAIIKGHRRCREVLGLRTGEAAVRIKRLLHLLPHSERSGDTVGPISCVLPSLKDIASIVNLTPESVCRILSDFRQMDQLTPRVRKSTRSRTLEASRGLMGVQREALAVAA
jgi:CRP-like cAMP-binding protein